MKTYVLIAYGGEWEDAWEKVQGVYSSQELAEAARDARESERASIAANSEELSNKWDAMGDYPKGDKEAEDAWNAMYILYQEAFEAKEPIHYTIEEFELDAPVKL